MLWQLKKNKKLQNPPLYDCLIFVPVSASGKKKKKKISKTQQKEMCTHSGGTHSSNLKGIQTGMNALAVLDYIQKRAVMKHYY